MPTFYSFNQNGQTYNFDDVFVPIEWFQSGNLWTWGDGVTIPTNLSSPGLTWKQVSCGNKYRCGIMMDGSLWGFGNNSNGQLGDNTTISKTTLVQEYTESFDWKQVDCGNRQTLAIKTNGTLWAWGQNDDGELGLGDNSQRNTPTQVGISSNWHQVSCGEEHTAAIRADGTLWTWGGNAYGQLGDNTVTPKNSPVQIPGNDWKRVSCGSFHTAAIKTDGTLWSWGQNYTGALGLGDRTQRNVPTKVGTNSDWNTISCGLEVSCSIKTDGSLWVWGVNNFQGRLGFDDTGDKLSPTQLTNAIDWKSAHCGRAFIAIKTDGTMLTWGSGDKGQMGDGSIDNNITPSITSRNESDWKQAYMSYIGTVGAISYVTPVI